jgi:hypothetical protein
MYYTAQCQASHRPISPTSDSDIDIDIALLDHRVVCDEASSRVVVTLLVRNTCRYVQRMSSVCGVAKQLPTQVCTFSSALHSVYTLALCAASVHYHATVSGISKSLETDSTASLTCVCDLTKQEFARFKARHSHRKFCSADRIASLFHLSCIAAPHPKAAESAVLVAYRVESNRYVGSMYCM